MLPGERFSFLTPNSIFEYPDIFPTQNPVERSLFNKHFLETEFIIHLATRGGEQMANKQYDAVVVGSGVGGCGVAALLAKDHGKNVVVLEKAPHIGGRVASYVGKGDKVTIDGQELDQRGFTKSLADSRCWVSYCEPDLKTMFAKGLLDGWTFENGGHGLFWGNKSRVRLLLDHLGKPVDLPVNKGLGFVDAKKNFEMYQVRAPYAWQSEEGFRATLSALRQMGGLTMEECAAAMEIGRPDLARAKRPD